MKLLEIARSPKHSGDVRRKVDICHSLLPLVSEDGRRAGTLGEPLRMSAWKATIGLYFTSALTRDIIVTKHCVTFERLIESVLCTHATDVLLSKFRQAS